METRKIQLVGNRSYSISLPKKWIKLNNLKEQDSLYLETLENNIVVKPIKTQIDENKTYSFNLDEIDNIKEFIVFVYIKNINSIKLKSSKKNIEYSKIASIKKVLTYLEGFDIIDQSEKEIEIIFMFKEINLNLQKIFLRILYLISLEFEAIKNNDLKMVEETEKRVDKLYHLGRRILFKSLNSEKTFLENNIGTNENILYYQMVLKKLENISDSIFIFKDIKLNEELIKGIELHLEVLNSLFKSKNKVSRNKRKLKEIETYNVLELKKIKHLIIDVFENLISIEYNNNYFYKKNQ